MPEESWEKYLDPGPGYQVDERNLRLHESPRNGWRISGQTLGQNYSDIRESERNARFGEVFSNVQRVYWSRNGILILAVSLLLCAITSVVSPEGFFFWNIVLFIIVWLRYEITARAPVRAEWEEVQEELETL